MTALHRHFQLGVISALATYLLLLGAGVWAESAYVFMVANPLRYLEQTLDVTPERERFLWYRRLARDDKKGVVVAKTDKTWGDYTFFVSVEKPQLRLVDLQGKIVRQWTIDWAAILGAERIRQGPVRSMVTRAFLQPDGSIYVLFTGMERTQGDYGMAKLDKDGHVVWTWFDTANHDIAILPNGNILTFAETLRKTPYDGMPLVRPPFIEPFLVMIDGKGREVNRKSFFDMFAESPHAKFLKQVGQDVRPANLRPQTGDILHPNTITPVTAEAAKRNPALREGQYLVSFRNFDLLATVDLEQNRITWAAYGPWRGQHSPRFIADGSVVMFDNLGNLRPEGGLSRILNADPVTGRILWEYDGTEADPVYSSYNSMVDPLPNGSVLATETAAGRIFEVTRGKEIVWDYRSPERLKINGRPAIPSLLSGRRFRREDLPFLAQTP